MAIRRSSKDTWSLALRLATRQSTSRVCCIRNESNGKNDSSIPGISTSRQLQRGNAVLKDPQNNKVLS